MLFGETSNGRTSKAIPNASDGGTGPKKMRMLKIDRVKDLVETYGPAEDK